MELVHEHNVNKQGIYTVILNINTYINLFTYFFAFRGDISV